MQPITQAYACRGQPSVCPENPLQMQIKLSEVKTKSWRYCYLLKAGDHCRLLLFDFQKILIISMKISVQYIFGIYNNILMLFTNAVKLAYYIFYNIYIISIYVKYYLE